MLIIQVFDKEEDLVNNFSINNTYNNFVFSTINGSLEAHLNYSINNTLVVDAPGYEIKQISLLGENHNNHNFSLYESNIFDITFYDFETNQLLNDTNISIIFIGAESLNRTVTNGTLYQNLLTPGPYTFIFSGVGYTQNQYITTLTDRTSQEIQLYLNPENDTTLVLITVKDKFGTSLTGVDITIQRYKDVSWVTEQILKTDNQGRTEGQFILSTEYYNFVLDYEGSTVFGVLNDNSNRKNIYAEDVTDGLLFTIDTSEGSNAVEYQESYTVDINLSYINDSLYTGYFRFYYNDVDNNQWDACLEVISNNGSTICECFYVTSESGIWTCDVSETNITASIYTARAKFRNIGSIGVLVQKVGGGEHHIDWGNAAYFFGWLIVLTTIFLFLSSPSVAIYMGTGTIAVLTLMGFIFQNTDYIVLISLVILGGIFASFKANT